MVYNEDAMSDDHEECVDILFHKYPNHDKVEQGASLDEFCYLNPQGQVLFQDHFFGFLESSKEGLCYARNGLLQSLMKSLSIVVQRQVKWEWPFYFFSLLKKVNKNQSCSHLLDWLHWRKEFT